MVRAASRRSSSWMVAAAPLHTTLPCQSTSIMVSSSSLQLVGDRFVQQVSMGEDRVLRHPPAAPARRVIARSCRPLIVVMSSRHPARFVPGSHLLLTIEFRVTLPSQSTVDRIRSPPCRSAPDRARRCGQGYGRRAEILLKSMQFGPFAYRMVFISTPRRVRWHGKL